MQKQPFRGNPHLFSVSSSFFHPSLFTIISVFFAFFPTRSYFSSPGFLPRFLFPLSSVTSLQTISFYSCIHALSVNIEHTYYKPCTKSSGLYPRDAHGPGRNRLRSRHNPHVHRARIGLEARGLLWKHAGGAPR